MAGHSKWAQIKHKKAVKDARRGKLFSKLIREITVAARLGGGDPDSNPRLRAAIEKAKSYNMPAENIERAIKKGTGELEGGGHYEELIFEGYAPGGVAVLIEALTDNRNRTAAEIRHVFTKHGGSPAEAGAVAWQFQKKGLIVVPGDVEEELVMEAAIEGGAEDVKKEENYEIITQPEDFAATKKALEERGITVTMAEITMMPTTTVRVEGETARKVMRLIEELEDLDDVQNVYSNFDVPEEVLQETGER